MNRDPSASEASIVKDSGGEKDPRAVPIVKLEERPPDPARVYRSGDDRYAVEPSSTTEGSCLGRFLFTSEKSTVEFHTNGDDTKYKLACVDDSISPGGTHSREMPRCEENTPVEQSERPVSVVC